MDKRKVCSAEEIRALVAQRVHSANGDINVPLPTRTAVDIDGCNWVMSVFSNAHAHLDVVEKVLRQTRTEVNLPEQ